MDRPSITINTLYFGTFFTLLTFLSTSSIIMKDPFTGIFFFLYAAGQAALETILLIVLGHWIYRTFGKPCFEAFIGATFVLLILHACDFFMNRILDLSIWATIGFVLDETWENLIFMFEASGVPLWFWGAFGFGLLLLPLIGVLLYRLCSKYSNLETRPEWIAQTLCCIPAALFIWDVSSSRVIHPDEYTAFTRLLPWKTTFLQPENTQLALEHPLKRPSLTVAKPPLLAKKPNIYLFVIESLREDFITHKTAPHLAAFRDKYIHFDLALSNGNASHISWFSLFHSQFPYFWRHTQQEAGSTGSPALRFLKELGYKIHLYSSADLGYYGMEELLFGDLLDSNHAFHYGAAMTAAESDQKAIEALRRAANEAPSGQVFITFLDSTHFGYSWPSEEAPAFEPVVHEFALFQIIQSKSLIEKIKNRYRSAIHHIDTLFGRFWDTLPNQKEAVVAIVGDHGEEFFEKGNLFHNSHLVHEQTHIPLYFKLGEQTRPIIQRAVISQMDIFPTLIDAVFNQPVSFLEGSSIFQKPTWPFAVIARYNAGRTPYEFALHNGSHKVIARFANHQELFAAQPLILRSLSDAHDNPTYECKTCSEQWVRQEFGPALDRLFKE